MAKFKVSMNLVAKLEVEVEAECEGDAQEAANDLLFDRLKGLGADVVRREVVDCEEVADGA